MTLKKAKEIAKELGYTIQKHDMEYRAFPKGQPELDCWETELVPLLQTVECSAKAMNMIPEIYIPVTERL